MRIAARGLYRAWQFWRALWAKPLNEVERSEVGQILTAGQLALFEEQSRAGQQHGYRVMRTLVDAGHEQHDLLVAALLHDVGKELAHYTWFDRVKVVLAQRLAPNQAGKWAQGNGEGWTRAFVVKAQHPEWGAEALAATGGSELSINLVRRHQESPATKRKDNEENRLLVYLQRADDQN